MNNNYISILVDANPLVGKKSGVGYFTERLIHSLAVNSTERVKLSAYYFNFLGLKKVDKLPNTDVVKYIEVRFLPSKLLSLLHKFNLQLPLELFLGFKKYDFLIFPNYVAIPSIRKTPYAIAIHDMGFEDYPKFLTSGNQKFLHTFVKRSIKNSSLIITISNFTKDRIYHYYKEIVKSNIISLPIPYEYSKSKGEISEELKKIVSKPYILHIGTIEPRKNLVKLIEGFALTPKVIRDSYNLVLAGSHGWKTEKIQKALIDAKEKINVIQTGYINDVERDFLYKNASLVCLISHYEGFGMPILEAMHYKKKLLLSSIPVFHEVAGDYAMYCNENDPNSIAKSIERTLYSKLVNSKIPDWSWKKNTESLINEISEIVNDTIN